MAKRKPFRVGDVLKAIHHVNNCQLDPINKKGDLFPTTDGTHTHPGEVITLVDMVYIPADRKLWKTRKERLEWSLWYGKTMRGGKFTWVPLLKGDWEKVNT